MPTFYKCTVCNRAFLKPDKLARHMRIHTGEAQFYCDICGDAFTKRQHFTAHERTHTGEKPFVCKICGSAFGQGGTLNNHMKAHSETRPYPCDTCELAFKRKSHLKSHMETTHQGLTIAVTTQSHKEPAGTVTSTTHTFSTGFTETTLSYVEANNGERVQMVTVCSGSAQTTTLTQSDGTIGFSESFDDFQERLANTLPELK